MRYLILIPVLFLAACASAPEPAPQFPITLVNAPSIVVVDDVVVMPTELFAEGMSESEMIEGIEVLYGYAVAQRMRAEVFEADSIELRNKMLNARKWIILNQPVD